LYDPTEGTIRVDGVDLRQIDLTSWRSIIAPLFQDFMRYDFSLRENVAVGNPECLFSKEKLIHASKRGGLDSIVGKLPQGYRTRLGSQPGDVNLSGGEWQRVSMARTLARQSFLLVFDEPTAALDPLFENEIFNQLSVEMTGKTAVIVTHRLGAVSLASRILVMERGKVREDGCHSALLQTEGVYAKLYRAQAEQYSL
jgi:ABC-type multidrug transport system fused ATPase/permease subunit